MDSGGQGRKRQNVSRRKRKNTFYRPCFEDRDAPDDRPSVELFEENTLGYPPPSVALLRSRPQFLAVLSLPDRPTTRPQTRTILSKINAETDTTSSHQRRRKCYCGYSEEASDYEVCGSATCDKKCAGDTSLVCGEEKHSFSFTDLKKDCMQRVSLCSTAQVEGC